jgi:MoxR-like ATPase
VSIKDVKAVAHIVLRHRIFLNFHADAEGLTVDAVIDRLLEQVPEPTLEDLKSVED